jgi:L-amino acid N-acyltransferase YncA
MQRIIKQNFSYAKQQRRIALDRGSRLRSDAATLKGSDRRREAVSVSMKVARMSRTTAPPAKAEIGVADAEDGDMPEIAAIYARHVATGLASFEEEPPSLEEMRRRRADALRLGLPYLVAKLAGKVAGYAYASPYRARSAYRFSIENSVYVADGMVGQGIGRSLLGALIARCEEGPWRQMIAIIGDSANAASIALHRAHGFRMVGTLRAVGLKHGCFVDTVLMQRELGAESAEPPGAPT